MDASVIIPTYNRYDSLVVLLEDLSRQQTEGITFEVILVDDGSTDQTLTLGQAKLTFPFTYLRQSAAGVVSARNAGASISAGGVLIFVDDDVSLGTSYVRALVKLHRKFPRAIGMGEMTAYLPPNPTPSQRQLASAFVPPKLGQELDFTSCGGANLSVQRPDYFEIGGMRNIAADRHGSWSDVDFGYRAWKLGYRFRVEEAAVCLHRDYLAFGLASAAERAERDASTVHCLVENHPGIEAHLPMFRDKSPVDWGSDPLRLVARKLLRRCASSRISLRLLSWTSRILASLTPSSATVLPAVHRWIIGAHIFLGYRRGLRRSIQVEFERANQTDPLP